MFWLSVGLTLAVIGISAVGQTISAEWHSIAPYPVFFVSFTMSQASSPDFCVVEPTLGPSFRLCIEGGGSATAAYPPNQGRPFDF